MHENWKKLTLSIETNCLRESNFFVMMLFFTGRHILLQNWLDLIQLTSCGRLLLWFLVYLFCFHIHAYTCSLFLILPAPFLKEDENLSKIVEMHGEISSKSEAMTVPTVTLYRSSMLPQCILQSSPDAARRAAKEPIKLSGKPCFVFTLALLYYLFCSVFFALFMPFQPHL